MDFTFSNWTSYGPVQKFYIKLRLLNDLHCYNSSENLVKDEKTYEELRFEYSKEFYECSKSDEALYSILCDLRRSSVENGGLSIGRKRLAEFGLNNGAEILKAEMIFQKWKETPDYPVNLHKKIDEETGKILEELN